MATVKFSLSLHHAISCALEAASDLNGVHFDINYCPGALDNVARARNALKRSMEHLSAFEAELSRPEKAEGA